MENKKVTLKMSWHEMLGEKPEDYTPEQRKARWLQWINLAKEKGDNDIIEYWTDKEACIDCTEYDEKNSWCNLMNLPNCINPILTMKHGIIGMACMGTGFERKGQQVFNFEENNELPF